MSANTAAKCYRLLRTILNTAVADELLARATRAGSLVRRRAGGERPTATVAQVWQLADAMPAHLRAMVLLAGFCGLRLGELLGLEQRHVNVLHGLLTVEQQEHQLRNGELMLGPPKSDAGRRTIALPPFLVPSSRPTSRPSRCPARTVACSPASVVVRCAVTSCRSTGRGHVRPSTLPAGFRFHDLRHTANTLTAATGASTRDLMHRMGHASPQAALRYQHATRARDTEIAKSLGELVEASRADSGRARGMDAGWNASSDDSRRGISGPEKPADLHVLWSG